MYVLYFYYIAINRFIMSKCQTPSERTNGHGWDLQQTSPITTTTTK